MRTLKNEILSSDIIIFGSLIYGTNVSGDTEVFFDRISYWYHILDLVGKSSLSILTSCGNNVNFALNYYTFIMYYLGLHIIDLYSINIFNSKQLSLDKSI